MGLLTILICLAVWMFTTRMADRQRRTRTCQSGIQVTVLDSAQRNFVGKEDIEKWLDEDYHAYVGLPLDSVNLDRIEQLVRSRSAVRGSRTTAPCTWRSASGSPWSALTTAATATMPTNPATFSRSSPGVRWMCRW